MTEQTRHRLIIVLGVASALGIIVLLLYFFLFRTNAPDVLENNDQGTAPPQTQPADAGDASAGAGQAAPRQNATIAPGDRYILQVTRTFVERFASYSNQNDNRHIEDALLLATPQMRTWVESQETIYDAAYAGVIARVIAASLEEKTDASAQVQVQVQEVQRTDTEETIQYRTGTVQLVRQGSEWKVNGLFWEE